MIKPVKAWAIYNKGKCIGYSPYTLPDKSKNKLRLIVPAGTIERLQAEIKQVKSDMWCGDPKRLEDAE